MDDKMVEGLQISKSRVFHLNSPPSIVFPLLCPKKEFDWVDGWDCEIIYSESGYAHSGCIFTTRYEPEGYSVWVMADYSPDRFIRIVKICPELFLLEWSFDLAERAEGGTDLKMIYMMTGLSEPGNDHVKTTMGIIFPQLMDRLEKSMNHYLKTGKKLIIHK